MAASSFSTSTWSFPDEIGSRPRHASSHQQPSIPGAFSEEERPEPSQPDVSSSSSESRPRPEPSSRTRRHWPPRTCRICLETVHPSFPAPPEHIPEILRSVPTPTYTSTDPSLGRLLRPCRCKGTSKYVHEGCLQAWRHADPSYGTRNYWQCPTCGFRYQLQRLNWGRWISSTAAQIVLTAAIFMLALFFMGFIADPIINFYAEPYSVFYAPRSLGERIEPILGEEEDPTWAEHFLKGLASLGLLGFVKAIITLSPWNWFNIRVGGSGRSGATGRDRMANVSWIVVFIGVLTFLWVSKQLHIHRKSAYTFTGSLQRSPGLEPSNPRKSGREGYGRWW